MDSGITPRRHNPVDSICRKLQTIQRRDRESNSPFQIPKLQSNSYDSPHLGLRRNLDGILKKRKGEPEHEATLLRLTPGAFRSSGTFENIPITPLTPANATYTLTGSLGTLSERGSTAPWHGRAWQLSCSTPAVRSPTAPFSFTPAETDRSKFLTPGPHSSSSNFSLSQASTVIDSELAYSALVVKRLSMGDGAVAPPEFKKDSMTEVSLICEEDLLDSIFQACDTQRRGKVYVSHIVDYLRHTTSRGSEDSGLEELSNMLDPEHKDISIDLDTYHAIMKEWIDDCRNQVKDEKEDSVQELVKLPDSLSAKRSTLMNMTSGSLEAFGGEASRAELETSDLVFCVADLQFDNQKLQEELRKLKQTREAMEETNQKLLEDNEELRTQAKMGQQILQRERLLKEEVEEMKLMLSSLEESKARSTAHSKHMERENQALLTKITALQDENMKVSMEVDELQKKIKTLCEVNADLQAQTHSFDAILAEKDSLIQEKSRQMEDLRVAVVEYSSVTELLRAEKSKLESQMQLLQPDVAIPGLSLSVAYRLNQTSSGSLETELALAQQSPLEGAEAFSSICMASQLDETLDREVLFLLQGPTPEQMSLEFKVLIDRLRREFDEETHAILTALKSPDHQDPHSELRLQGLQVRLEQRHGEWTHSLEQLKQYTDSLEKELLKMASNMRRSRTEILHLSVRVKEQEIQRQQLSDELHQLQSQKESGEHSSQTADAMLQVNVSLNDSMPDGNDVHPVEEEPPGLKAQQDEDLHESSRSEQEDLERTLSTETAGGEQDEEEEEEEECVLRGSCDVLTADEAALQAHVEQEPRLPDCMQPDDAHKQAVSFSADDAPLDTPKSLNSDSDHTSTPSECRTTDGPPDRRVREGGETSPHPEDDTTVSMSNQKLTQEQLSDVSTGLERGPLMPVAEEEEPVADGSNSAGKKGRPAALLNTVKISGAGDSVSKTKDASASLGVRNNIKKNLETTGGMEVQGNNDSTLAEGDGDAAAVSGDGLTQSEKDIEAEFQRLSLSQRCDMFTLEKRLRVEERSRDLAEENVRKEVSSCQGLLQALIPLCGEDNQSMEIIQRLQKNLELLVQSVSRVASRSEMLGAIHQEVRMGQAIEVMIQHVENLRRTYTKEHTELLELRENNPQSSFGPKTEKEKLQTLKKPANALFKQVTAHRGNIVALSRNGRGVPNMDLAKGGVEKEQDKLSRSSPGNSGRSSVQRAPLKRFFSSGCWASPAELAVGCECDANSEEEQKEALKRRRTSLTELGIRITSFVMPTKTANATPDAGTTVSGKTTKTQPADSQNANPCSWLAILLVLAGFLVLLSKLLLQPAVNAAPVGTGDSWMTIQQILWPFTGLRHNGRPPV